MQRAKKEPKKKGFRPPEDPSNPTGEEFVLMVEAHDPMYVWSLDQAERERGDWERAAIDEARDRLGDSFSVPVWNRAMHRKVVPSMLGEFLWRVRKN